MQRFIKLIDGYSWNPLAKCPRNLPCLCGSGRKIKKCCGFLDSLPSKNVTELNELIKDRKLSNKALIEDVYKL